MKTLRWFCVPALLLLAGMSGCTGLPENVKPVTDFELDRYLGKWYEIARLDHSFERGLSNVSAMYSLREGGGVKVVNRGYSEENQKWEEAIGKAYFVDSEESGYLKVSFFGPFYGSYVIFDLDKEGYQYSFVSGPDKSFIWLLARTPEVSEVVTQRFRTMADALGFDTTQLIWVKQDKNES